MPTSGWRISGRKLILMNAPRRPDGPPVRGGLPYSAIAHLAEDVNRSSRWRARCASAACRRRRCMPPTSTEGLLLLEDLGTEGVVAGDPPAPIEERYAAAVDVLVELHRQPVLGTLPVAPGVDHRLPPYDLDAFLIEAELLIDWYLPHRGDLGERCSARAEFDALWREALARAYDAPPTWVLRDYHSPNLLWLPEREGVARVGLLDFQDAADGAGAL